MSPKKVLFGVDASNACLHAFLWATDKHHHKGDHWTLVHVEELLADPALLSSFVASEDELEAITQKSKARAQQLLNQYAARLEKMQIECTTLLLSGDPKVCIVQETEKNTYDELVIGSRGMGAVKRSLIGSTSDYCVHHANCAVLVVKPREDEYQAQVEK